LPALVIIESQYKSSESKFLKKDHHLILHL